MTGSFEAVGYSGTALVQPGQSLALALSVASEEAFIGRVVLQRNLKGDAWEEISSYEGTEGSPLEGAVTSETLINDTPKPQVYRLSCTAFGEASDPIDYSLAAQAAATSLAVDSLEVGALTVTEALNVPNIPTADPEVADQVYSDGGIVTVSAGEV